MKTRVPIIYALLAALLFGINAPFSKMLLKQLHPLFLAALLYLGAGIGMLIIECWRKIKAHESREAKLSKREIPTVFLMIILDIAAPIFLLLGLKYSNAGTVSLLGNFEIVATTMIAMIIFKEHIGKRLWAAIACICVASVILTIEDLSTVSISIGAIFVLLACICWGFENNCTRNLSIKDPLQVVVCKGFGSGLGALFIAIMLGEITFQFLYIVFALILGFVSYGLSIYFYVSAQRKLGAARTSAYYAVAPFIGVLISWIILKDTITLFFLVSLIIMLLGAYFASFEDHYHKHCHLEECHNHKHNHHDNHHNHVHGEDDCGEHCHEHHHEYTEHRHAHLPDVHHRHIH